MSPDNSQIENVKSYLHGVAVTLAYALNTFVRSAIKTAVLFLVLSLILCDHDTTTVKEVFLVVQRPQSLYLYLLGGVVGVIAPTRLGALLTLGLQRFIAAVIRVIANAPVLVIRLMSRNRSN